MTFDPALLTYASYTAGSGAGGATLNVNDAQKLTGKLGVILALPAGQVFAAGTPELVRLSFAAAAGTSTVSTAIGFGDSPVAREISDATANALVATYQGGTLTLQGSGGGGSRTISAANTTIARGATGEVKIILAAQGDENALGFSVTFDPALLSYSSYAAGSGAVAATINVNDAQKLTGKLGVVMALPAGQTLAAGAKELVKVTFSAASGTSTVTTPIGFGDTPVAREVSSTAAAALAASYQEGTVTLQGNGTPEYSYSYWIPVATHAAGSRNSQWRTDLGMLNLAAAQATVEVRFYAGGGVRTSTTYVPANTQSAVVDIVGQIGSTGSAALEVRSDKRLLVTSRTYNLVSAAESCYPNGTLGQDYPTYAAGAGLSPGTFGWLPQLAESAAYRTNIAVTNTSTAGASVKVELVDGAGLKLVEYTVTLTPGQFKQENQPFKTKAGQTNLSRGYAKVTVLSGSGIVAYASVIDNITNDPTTVLLQVVTGDAAARENVTIYLGPGDSVPLELVPIPAGAGSIGSPDSERGRDPDEGPQHQVTISRPFFLGRTEVTQAQWQAVMGTPMPTDCGSYGVGADYPVYCVSWNEVCGGATGWDCAPTSFIGKLNAQQSSAKYRLPTEAEWEYAARAGTATEFSFTAPPSWDTGCGSFPAADPYIWWCGNSSTTCSPVGSKLPNLWDLFDMHGNVWEWVGDWYGSYTSSEQTDPGGPAAGSGRVVRGGTWGFSASNCRSANRGGTNPGNRFNDCGFRVARSE